ncbi:TonB-system energizer ExbB [Desulfurivibrio alkaliphilus]|uniref:TonB-system energizer ExbB n=1 Tax=Desulfurivibrio alkaliphilus (strain DSM 19089 / UNIQEM U267 / AHT2) TaxID=589865 RepID=D6Z1X2_DESAT|nr:TonB-system energizer ExbB [Desulfurivibrio alkaliphilus]ADH85547.1 tonB-system energizer ExbB [Desulfurivibrio alkaliphilus AHT 2]
MDWIKYTVDYGIIGLLILMSIVVLAIVIERLMVYRNLRLDEFKDKRKLELELTGNLHLIGTVGRNAPYLGLLGTVLGIMLTFYDMGASGRMDAGQIMVGLSLALKVTAAGLLVAIPAVTAYNLLQRRVKVLVTNWEIRHG